MAKKDKNVKDPKARELDGAIQVEDQGSATDMSMGVNTPANTSSEIQEIKEPKAAINTKKAAEVVSGGLNSNMGGGLRRNAGGLSGGAGGIRGDNSAITKEQSPYRSGTATGKRADPITRKADTVDAEVFKTFRHEAEAINETSDDQFWNGEYENEHVITQRRSGGVPADPNFERSVDSIEVDMLYFNEGQFNKPRNQENLSIHSWDANLNGGNGGYSNPTNLVLGNYLARDLVIGITRNNGNFQITQFDVNSDNLTLETYDERTIRRAGDAFLRFKNQSELDRQVMIDVAGNESDASGWSPLGEAIVDATDQNRALRIIESTAGDFVYTSTRKLSTALAHQVNKLKKDGPRLTGPMTEMVNGHVELEGYGADGAVAENVGRARCFDSLAYVNGGAGLWLALNDSLPKYTTKGKLLSLPLSFKSALSYVKSQAAPLVMHAQLKQLFEKNELYSTIDGPYDPLKPIVITDNAGLITPLPINAGCTLVDGELQNTIWVQHFEEKRNNYNYRITNYFMGGIFRWIKERAQRIFTACADQAVSNVVTIRIPIVSSTTSISLWDLIVCSSVQYMVDERRTQYGPLLKYEKNHGYPYTGLMHMSEVDYTTCDNFNFTDVDSPISDNVAKPTAAMKIIMPEVFWPVAKVKGEGLNTGHNGIASKVVLPHYFVQNQFIYDKDDDDNNIARQLILSDEYCTMAYPGTRDGNNFAFFDNIYGMSQSDYRLSLDMMVTYPGYQPSYSVSKIARAASSAHPIPIGAMTYKYGLVSDGTPVIPYFAYADDADNVGETLQIFDILATPRELGLMQIAPAGVLSPICHLSGAKKVNTLSVNSSYLGKSGPGFKIRYYHANGSVQNTILNPGDINLDNAASLMFYWDCIQSTPNDAGKDIGIRFNSNITGASQLNPFVVGSYATAGGVYDTATGTFTNGETKDTAVNIYSNMKYMWNRLQRLPFAINPFDCNTADLTDATSVFTSINSHDIYDMLYIFGFIGFRASDFSLMNTARIKERIAKGMNYTADPYVVKTSLLK